MLSALTDATSMAAHALPVRRQPRMVEIPTSMVFPRAEFYAPVAGRSSCPGALAVSDPAGSSLVRGL
jgi:hypothetical protein